jgi:hypothetical protein
LTFEVPIDNHRVTLFGCDIGPLNVSGLLLLFDAESWFFHVSPVLLRPSPKATITTEP